MDVKKIKVGKLDVITKCPDGKDKYLVSAINVGDVEWWSHSAHKKAFPGFRGSAKLVKIDDKYFVALCTTTVDTIFPLGSISEMTWTPDGDYVCRGFGLDQRVDAKTAIAAELSLTPCWTSGEYVVVEEHRRLEAQTQLLAQRAAREAERQVELARKKKEEDDRAQAVAERRMKKLGIMARTKIFVRVEGVNRPHIPVVGDEWQYLERETRCLAVSSYDEAGIGNKIETFTVGWEHGKTRIGIQAVPKAHGHAPKAKITVVSLSTRTVVINRKAETAFVAGTMGQAMNLLKTGSLKEGALVSIGDRCYRIKDGQLRNLEKATRMKQKQVA